MKKIFIAILLFSKIHAAELTTDLVLAYTSLETNLVLLTEELKKANKALEKVRERIINMKNNQAAKNFATRDVKNASAISVKILQAFSDSVALRSESLSLKNKQLLQKIIFESYQISEDETKDFE